MQCMHGILHVLLCLQSNFQKRNQTNIYTDKNKIWQLTVCIHVSNIFKCNNCVELHVHVCECALYVIAIVAAATVF